MVQSSVIVRIQKSAALLPWQCHRHTIALVQKINSKSSLKLGLLRYTEYVNAEDWLMRVTYSLRTVGDPRDRKGLIGWWLGEFQYVSTRWVSLLGK